MYKVLSCGIILSGRIFERKRKMDISMSGKGRCLDNILPKRLRRPVKYEVVCLRDYGDVHELIGSLRAFFD